MTAVADKSDLLDELLCLPAERRAARLVERVDVDATIVELGDQIERLALQEVNKSRSAAEVLVSIADELGGKIAQARARRALAHSSAYCGRHEEALKHASDGRLLAESTPDGRIEAARCMLISLHPLGSLGRFAEAVALGEAARAALLRSGEPKLAARADFNLGGIHQKMDNPARALLHFDRAAPLFVDDPLISGYLQNNRGEALLQLQEFDAAEAAYRAALFTCDRAGMSVAAAIAEGNLAELSAQRGSLSQALFHFERSRRRLEGDGAESHLARLLAEQAEAFEALGLTQEAHDGYLDALPRLEQLGLASEAARARVGLGRACMRLGKRAEAEAALREGEISLRRLGQVHARARVDVLCSELALANAQPEAARELLARAAAELQDRPLDVVVLAYHRAQLALADGQPEEAQRALSDAIPIAEQLDLAPLRSDLYGLRARVERRLGRLECAIVDGYCAVAQIERVRGALQADRFRAAFLGNRLAAYEDLVDALLSASGRDTEAFDVIEKAKSRSLLDAVRGAVGDEGRGDAADESLRCSAGRLRAELNVLYSQFAEHGERASATAALGGYREGIRVRERELASIDARLSAGRGVDNFFAAPSSFDQVVESLPAEGCLVEYYVVGEELLALVGSRNELEVVRRLCSVDALQAVAERVRFQLNRAARPGATQGSRGARLLDDLRRELAALHAAILSPLLPYIGPSRTLVVVPHGPLHLMPFHALWDGQQYAVERFEIVLAPSGSVFAAAIGGAASAAGEPLVIGVADEVAPWISVEARELAQRLGATALIDDDATVATVCAAMRSARWVHLACHGHYSSQHPMASGLRLFDRWLTLRDICELRLGAELVTLSACNSGRNLVQSGEELTGLLRSFLAAGARSVLASLWPAHDAATTELMCDFYSTWTEHGKGSGSTARALRQAQLRAMRRAPHPIYWAPFALVGRP